MSERSDAKRADTAAPTTDARTDAAQLDVTVERSSDPELTRTVNGVFQGGGAKSIAYVGALEAIADRGIWFGSVAGTSAGAIAASLIAAGLGPTELKDAIPDGLTAARKPIAQRLALAAAGQATSLFEGSSLRTWLDRAYAEAIGHDRSLGPVTFRQLFDASQIELYVVSLDLATELPVVFSRRSTPDVDVAGAVVASSAIPSAFPAARAVVHAPEIGARVHHLIDGGGWANYPSFVFADDGFRTWLRGEVEHDHEWTAADERSWAEESDRPILGLVFGAPDPPDAFDHLGFVPLDGDEIDDAFDLGPTSTSGGTASHLIGSVLASNWTRSTIALAVVVWVAMSIATMPIAFRRYSTWLDGWAPDLLYPIALVGTVSIAVLAVVVSIALIVVLVLASRLLADTALPAVTTVIGTPSEVPPWLGLGARTVVIRVPREGLSTIGFDVDAATRQRAVAAARLGVASQLAHEPGTRLNALLAGREAGPATHPRALPQTGPADAPSPVGPTPWPTIAGLVALSVVVGVLAWWVTTAGTVRSIWWIVGGAIAAVIAIAVAVRQLARQTARDAHARASAGVSTERAVPASGRDPRLVAVAGVVLVGVGLTLSVIAMDDRADDTLTAEVVAAVDVGDGVNRYELVTDEGGEIDGDLTSSRHLRVGEAVFVELGDDGTVTLAGPLDDPRFAVAIVAIVVGVGAIATALQTQRWSRRSHRLAAFADTRLHRPPTSETSMR